MLIVWFFAYKKLAQFAVRCALPPRRSESPVCATDNKPSCVLHLLGWFIGSGGFSSLERRPEFWGLQIIKLFNVALLQRVIKYILKIYNLIYILRTIATQLICKIFPFFFPPGILSLQSFSMKTSVKNSI